MASLDSKEACAASPAPQASAETPPPVLSSAQLFQDHKSIRIAHEGQLYLLRITRENKLILTK